MSTAQFPDVWIEEDGSLMGVDPDTGETSTIDVGQRASMAAHVAMELEEARTAAQRVCDLEALLVVLLERGKPLPLEQGTFVREAGKAPNRSVNRTVVREHAEQLEPIGLAPVKQPPMPQPDKFPTVGQLDSKQSRAQLAGLGLTPEAFIVTPTGEVPDVLAWYPAPKPE